MQIETKSGVAIVRSDTPLITNIQSALDLMASLHYESGCDCVALAKEAIIEEFFTLSNGIAGGILQKFVQYQCRLAIFGDFSQYTSKTLRAFMYESNRGGHIFFVETEEEALARLEPYAAKQEDTI